jgi:hypothetical protein
LELETRARTRLMGGMVRTPRMIIALTYPMHPPVPEIVDLAEGVAEGGQAAVAVAAVVAVAEVEITSRHKTGQR